MTQLAQLSKPELLRRLKTRCKHHHTLITHPKCDPSPPRRVGFFDIETYGLEADFGILLSFALLIEGHRPITGVFRESDIHTHKPGEEDRRVVEAAVAALQKVDLIITHYGNDYRFDVPFLRTRAVALGIPFPPYGTLLHADTYPILKSKFRLRSNRQENAARTLLGHTEKNHLSGAVWRAAARGNPKALAYVLHHNIKDVRDLRRVWNVISPYTPLRPRWL